MTGGLILLAFTKAFAADVQFKRDIVPLLKARCAICHLTGEEGGNMPLYPAAAFKALVGVASVESPLLRVKPSAPEESYLIRKLEGTHIAAGGQGARMPMEGPSLTVEEIAKLRDWIADGAPDN